MKKYTIQFSTEPTEVEIHQFLDGLHSQLKIEGAASFRVHGAGTQRGTLTFSANAVAWLEEQLESDDWVLSYNDELMDEAEGRDEAKGRDEADGRWVRVATIPQVDGGLRSISVRPNEVCDALEYIRSRGMVDGIGGVVEIHISDDGDVDEDENEDEDAICECESCSDDTA